MANVGIYLDKRYSMKDGSYPVKIRIKHHKTFLVHTQMYAFENQWDGKEYCKNARNWKLNNIVLRRKLDAVERMILKLEDEDKIRWMSDADVKDKAEIILSNKRQGEERFADVITKFMQTKINEHTLDGYRQTRQKLEEYDSEACYHTITKQWLNDFRKWMEKDGLKTNTISIHLRNMRAAWNYAMDNEWTDLYPFRGLKIKNEVTKVNAHLTIEQIRQLKKAKLEPYQVPYRNVFLLMMYLRGINAVDLLANETTRIEGDRLVYIRMKTQKKYSVKIEEPARKLLNRMLSNRDDSFLKCCKRSELKAFCVAMNRGLKRICPTVPERSGYGGKKDVSTAICDKMTINYARHTFATVAYAIGIHKDDISLMLGHTLDGARITDNYIDYTAERTDECAQKVISYIASL